MKSLNESLDSIYKHIQAKQSETAPRKKREAMESEIIREATEREEPARKPLPLLDEEELAGISNPEERERRRRCLESHYKQFPNSRIIREQQTKLVLEEREKEKNKVVMLVPWADERRAAPNAVFRSALFPALSNQKRMFVKDKHIFSVTGSEVTFTGEEFDQSDLDVYLELLHIAKEFPLGETIKFSAYSMLKRLGRCTGKRDHQWLHSVLVRLRGGTVQIITARADYFGGLIEGGIRDKLTKQYEVEINKKFADLFGFGLWSSIDIDQRRNLEKKAIAKALHAYYSTHVSPALHRYDTLAGIAGLQNKNTRDVKAKLIKAHEELEKIGFLSSFEAKRNGIETVPNMTEGQQRHALKKITKAADPV